MTLNSQLPLQYIKGVGPKRAEAWRISVSIAFKDIFMYFPRGYLDRSQIVRIADLKAMLKNGEAVTISRCIDKKPRRTKRSNKLIFMLTVKDESGFLRVFGFEGFYWLKMRLRSVSYLHFLYAYA